MESLNLSNFVSEYIKLTTDEEMINFRDNVMEFLKGNKDDISGISPGKPETKKIRREFQLLGQETVDFMFDVLARCDLLADQVRSIISDDRENVSITASIEEMNENPYIIFEQYKGCDADDIIPFYKIDNGVIPSPEYGIDEILDAGSTERFRAFCVDELNKIAAHSFGKAETILQVINERIERLPEWKRYVFRMKNFDVEQNILNEALVQRRDDKDDLYLYLKSTYEDERIVERTLRELAERTDIPLKMAITPEKFKSGLKAHDSPLIEKAADEYELILEHQADICMQIFNKPLCVLSGAAGTGKTTVIRTLLENIDRVHGAGTSYLLMAPTGKAAERIKTQTGKKSSTIHSHLAKYGWINSNFTMKRAGGAVSRDVNTIIIDECSMIDLSLFAALIRSINWNSVQRLILIGDPNQLPPIGRGKVFADTIEWLSNEYPENLGTLTDNIRQRVNIVEGNGKSMLRLADIFIQENQRVDNADKSAELKAEREKLFEDIVEKGNDDIDNDLGVYFWNEQEDLEKLLPDVMIRDMRQYTGTEESQHNAAELWRGMTTDENGSRDPEIVQVISPYRGEFYGTNALNLLMQKTFNPNWDRKQLKGIAYGDKVIQFRNRPQSDPAYAYQQSTRKNIKSEIYNGEIGIVIKHGFDAYDQGFKKYNGKNHTENVKRIQVIFSGKTRQGLRYNYGKELGRDSEDKIIPAQEVQDNLELAYAISVHKSQGSEFDYVYIVIPDKESHLMSMELLYTAITRAQKKVTLFIQRDVSTLVSLSRSEKSAVRKINSSVFRFEPLPDIVLYADNKWYESGKKVSTLSKYFVRSKSEAIIANLLVDRDVPFNTIPLSAY